MKIGINEVMTINEIMREFDFEKVSQIMEAIKWKWELPKLLNDDPGDNPPADQMTHRAPTAIEMRRAVNMLLLEAFMKETNTSDGGFEVLFSWVDDKKKKFTVTLNFVPEDITITTNRSEEKNENDKEQRV